ncbi:LANO_0F15698g1_1 [Lachancea nothofagi CBS 11611]|uniref:Proteasome assembly chaperone 2 n=1 Tax=Lachancea nothofagi CBS 11611 TaxID=1266666 RepID=A0A1G4KCL1_9SACH|nr:LANO_0F15698g1_1 [Lachancea nothofagi CBS 11611]
MDSLLLPLVSTGNVPQLATDLILHSLSSEFQFVRELDSLYLFPFAGPLDYVKGSETSLYEKTGQTFTTPLELFYSSKSKLYIIQQRSPILQPFENTFCKEVIAPLLEELQIGQLLVLDATDNIDESIISRQLRKSAYSIGTCDLSQITDIASEFEEKLQINDQTSQSVNKTLFKFSDTSFQSGVCTAQFVYKLCYHLLHTPKASSLLKEISYLNTFVQEGDNSEDAIAACNQLPQILSSFPRISHYKTPVSWEGVYGVREAPSSFEDGLYI